jgi:hypothetical protein
MSQSKKNDDDSDAVPSSPTKKTAEEAFALAAKSILPARRRTQPNIYGSTPSPSPPPLPKPTTSKKKPTTSKKKPTAPLVNSGRTNQSNNKSQKKRGRVSTKKKNSFRSYYYHYCHDECTPRQSILDYEWYVPWFSLCVCYCMCRAYRSFILIFFYSIPHILITSFSIFQSDKKAPSAPISTTVTTNVPPGNPSLPMNGTFLGSLSQ